MSETSSKPSALPSNLYFGVLLIVAILIAITVYSGKRTGRFGEIGGLDIAKQRVRSLPMSIGDWVAAKDDILDKADVATLNIAERYVFRTYENKLTGDTVHFILMVGPTGHLVVHTPETCFGGENYVKDESVKVVSFPVADREEGSPGEDRLWKITFQHRTSNRSAVLFYYGIKTDDGDFWRASEYPRTEFQKYPFVYKMQIQALGTVTQEEGETDAVALFLRDALPTIRQCLRAEGQRGETGIEP